MAYLYNYAGEPWKTQQRVRQILDEMYQNQPDGLSGNEDCGQMSAWYVLSAMGFYQVTPGDPIYTLGSPIFDKVTLNLENGNRFVIEAAGASSKNCYFKQVTLNNTDLSKNWISHETIMKGGVLKFDMSDQPSTWGAAEVDRPVSAILEASIVPVPFIEKGERSFRGEQELVLKCLDPEAKIYYVILDNPLQSVFTKDMAVYNQPVRLDKSGFLYAYAKKNEVSSQIVAALFSQIPEDLHVHQYNTKYNPQYTARGDEGLIDGIRGSQTDFRTGDWQGFEGVNLDLVVDLGKSKKIKRVSAGFMQDENAWIFFPTKMMVEVSEDGKNFTPAGEFECPVSPMEKGVIQKDFDVKLKRKKARYVRIVGVSLGKCPDYHKGRGYPCWVFADEVMVE